MARRDSAREEIRERLQEAIAELRLQLSRVEIWAQALDGFSRPVPGYTPDNKYLLAGKSQKNH
jgi:hypothetical protein